MPDIEQAELDRLRQADRELHQTRKDYDDAKSTLDRLGNDNVALKKSYDGITKKYDEVQSRIAVFDKKENYDKVMDDVESTMENMTKEQMEKEKNAGVSDPDVMSLDLQFVRPYARELEALDHTKRDSDAYKATVRSVLDKAYTDMDETFKRLGVSPAVPMDLGVAIPQNIPAPHSGGGGNVNNTAIFSPEEHIKQRTKKMGRGFSPEPNQ